MGHIDDEQLKDQLEHELDILQFLDICQLSFREIIDMVFEQGVSDEVYTALEKSVR
jgi:hypothetical protein